MTSTRLSDSVYRRLFESAPGLNLILTPEFKIVAVSDAYLAATMTRREDIIDRGLFEVFPDNPGDPEATGEMNLRWSLRYALENRVPHAMAIQRYDIRKSNGDFEIRYWSPINTPVLDNAGDVELIIHRVEDVTEFVELERQSGKSAEMGADLLRNIKEAVRFAETRYRDVLDNMLEAAQVLSYDWRYLYLNDAAARNGRQLKEEMLGKKVMDRFPGFEETEMFAVLSECMRTRIPKIAEFEFTYPEGSTAWYAFSIQPCPEGLFILALDFTDRKKASDEIRKLNANLDERVRERTEQLEEANGELEAFTYTISHDLRAPLRHIQGYIEMLALSTKGQLGETSERYMQTISAASAEMSQLIDDLLAFSRVGKVEIQRHSVDLDQLVEDTVTGFAPESTGRNIAWKIARLPHVNGDEAMLKVVLTNLIGNAIKYTRRCEFAEIEIGCIPGEGEQSTVYVKDNGAGFDMNYSHRLFGVFQRLHSSEEFEGTGIGLAIVKRIVSRHGGRTWAEGKVDKGATIYFTLPNALPNGANKTIDGQIVQ